MKRRNFSLFVLGIFLLLVSRGEATTILHALEDAVYEYRNFTPRTPCSMDNFNKTSLNYGVFKLLQPNGLYAEDVVMIEFDLRSLQGMSTLILNANLVIERIDGDLINHHDINFYFLEDDGIIEPDDFFRPAEFIRTVSIPPRPSGSTEEEFNVEMTESIQNALQNNINYFAFLLEDAEDFREDERETILFSSEATANRIPRIEVDVIPEPSTIILMSCGLLGLIGIVIRHRRKDTRSR